MKLIDEEIKILSEKMIELKPENWADMARFTLAASILLPHRIGFYADLNPKIWGEAQSPVRGYKAAHKAHTALLRGADFFDILDTISDMPEADFSSEEAIGYRVASAIKAGLHLEHLADAVGFSILGNQDMAPEQFLENAREAAGLMRAEMEEAYRPTRIAEAACKVLTSEFRNEQYKGMIITCFMAPKFVHPKQRFGEPGM